MINVEDHAAHCRMAKEIIINNYNLLCGESKSRNLLNYILGGGQDYLALPKMNGNITHQLEG